MIKILTNGRGEVLIKPLKNFIKHIKIEGLHDICKNYHDYNSFYELNKCLTDKKFDIVHMNCRPDLFLFKKKKNIKYIYEAHTAIPGMNFKYGNIFIENPFKKLIYVILYPIFKLFYKIKVSKIDLFYVAIPGLLELTRGKAKRLPNPIDLSFFYRRDNGFELDNNYVNVFYPNGLRKSKNCKYALDLMHKIQYKYNKVRFYMINSHGHTDKYKKELDSIKNNTIRLNKIPRDEMPNYYSANWDLLLGSFSPEKPYAMLNMIENEAMACKAPILCCDLNEVIFEPLNNLEKLAYKIIEDKEYRNWYVERNYDYIKKVHSCEAVSKIYDEDIKELLKN